MVHLPQRYATQCDIDINAYNRYDNSSLNGYAGGEISIVKRKAQEDVTRINTF
jgi:hypothetical protein